MWSKWRALVESDGDSISVATPTCKNVDGINILKYYYKNITYFRHFRNYIPS